MPTERSIQKGLILALVATLCGAAIGLFWSRAAAIGFACGALWNVVNVFLLERLMRWLLSSDNRRKGRLILLLAAKFGLLYPAAIALLWLGWAQVGPFALGFTVVLAVIAACVALDQPVEATHV